MEKMLQFLKGGGAHPDNVDMERGVVAFRRAMQAGLEGSPSSLMMLPAYIDPAAKLPVRKPVAVLDAGGTNLRAALVSFETEGPVIHVQRKCPMPGTNGKLSWDEFLHQLAKEVAPLAQKTEYLGFCFSFPAEITPETDGRIINFNKEVQVEGAEGRYVCRELMALLNSEYGCHITRFSLLNDTVATLLGGFAAAEYGRYDSFLGFILGTGMNCCYVEPSREMVINMEAGGYDGFVRSPFDIAVDENSVNPGDHQMEKMVSGGYLGSVIGQVLKGACRAELFSAACGKALLALPDFDMALVSAFLEGRSNPLSAICKSQQDRDRLRLVVEMCVARAAKMVAVMFAAVLEQTDAGKTLPVCIVAEGSTFWKCEFYRRKIDEYLEAYAGKEHGREYYFVSAEDANLCGASAAALLKGGVRDDQ